MSLTSLSFIGIYFPLILLAYYNPFFKTNSFRKLILLFASLGLYAFSCSIKHTLLLVFLLIINYIFVEFYRKNGNQIFKYLAIGIDVFVLLFYKYLARLLGVTIACEELASIALPIGVSYYTFKLISYVIDSKKTVEHGSIIDVAIYVTNFLTVVSGPLSTYIDELPSIQAKKETSFDTVYKGFERIIIGLGKKVLIADSLATLVDQCFTSSNPSVVMSWAGAIAFTLQIFFDFSGYTDIVLGAGCLFGFDLPENFNYPYIATSISDFWKRWHISLTKWLTEYIYIPLGGSKVNSVFRHLLNLFAVWFISGIWHGSKLTFLVWAMIYFVLQAAEKYTKYTSFLNRIHIGRLYTIIVVIVEWVIFRSDSLSSAYIYIKGMFAFSCNTFCLPTDISAISGYAVPLVLGIIFSTPIGKRIRAASSNYAVFEGIYHLALIAILCICLTISVSQGYSAPLYADF